MLTDSMNEECLEHARTFCGVLNFYACKGVHTLFTGQRERDVEYGHFYF